MYAKYGDYGIFLWHHPQLIFYACRKIHCYYYDSENYLAHHLLERSCIVCESGGATSLDESLDTRLTRAIIHLEQNEGWRLLGPSDDTTTGTYIITFSQWKMTEAVGQRKERYYVEEILYDLITQHSLMPRVRNNEGC